MRQNKSIRIMALILSLTMITSVFVGNTLSRYVTSVSSTDSARVAVWGINGEEVTMELFNTEYDLGGKLIAKSNVDGEKIIAPGTGGQSAFSIINFESDTIPPEVSYTVKIDFNDSQVDERIKNNSSIQWKLDNNAWGTWDEMVSSVLLLSGGEAGFYEYAPGEFANAFKSDIEHTISWQWAMDGNNEIDTQMGNDALIGDISARVTVKITAEQSDGSSVNMLDGANQVINNYNAEPAVFRSVAPMEDLLNVTVNDEIVDPSNYDVASGSTIITFHKDYLETLEKGTYTININSKNDITATAKFYVVEKYVPIIQANIIPEGGIYYVGGAINEPPVDDTDWYEEDASEILVAGDEFPEPQTGDIYIYGDYEYGYNIEPFEGSYWSGFYMDGWGVNYLGGSSNPGKILGNIGGKNIVSLSWTFRFSNLTKFPIIPDTVEFLEGTFADCSKITVAPEIPSSVKYMDKTFSGSNITKAPVIPEGVISLNYAFYECDNLVEVSVISEGVKYMVETFSDCYSLVKAPKIPNTVVDLNWAFYNCTSLVEAPVIPEGVDNIEGTFYNCTSLTGVIKIDANPSYYDEVLYNTGISYITGSISDELKQEIYLSSKLTSSVSIDERGTYIVGAIGITPGNYVGYSEIYFPEDEMPETVKTGDVYVKGNYEYRYNMNYEGDNWVFNTSLNGWGVKLLNTSITEAGEILKSINGKDVVSIKDAFSYSDLVKAPVIHENIKYIDGAFYYCSDLNSIVEINTNLVSYEHAFMGTSIKDIVGNISDVVKNRILKDSDITIIVDGGDISQTGIYYVGIDWEEVESYDDATYKYINGAMPETVRFGDVYIYGDYEYGYDLDMDWTLRWAVPSSLDGWSVRALSNKSSYGEILKSINGKDIVNMNFTFTSLDKLIEAPEIPETVETMYATFSGCRSLVNAPVIPIKVKETSELFEGCSNLTGTVVFNANPISYGTEFMGTMKPIILTGSSDMLDTIAKANEEYNDQITVAKNN